MSGEENGRRPRILMFSQRNIYPRDAWRTPHYEFENIIRQIDAVDLVAPWPNARFSQMSRLAQGFSKRIGLPVKLGIPSMTVTHRYDMLFVFVAFPKDLLNFNPAGGWRDRCKTSVCMIDEIWLRQIPKQRSFLKNLSCFDHIVLYYSQSVKTINELTRKDCHFLPPGIDALKFCPYPDPPKRVIDVYSIGRRAKVTHQKLLEMTRQRDFFYIYDSLAGSQVINWEEHRAILANIAKRSRIYIVNPGLIDLPEVRGNQIEIGNRYFEGVAAGCILVGEIPQNEAYGNLFDWPDAMIPLPFDSDRIGEIISELDKHPDREEAQHRNNIVHALRRHDWTYRWESILRIAGLDPAPGLFTRKERLERTATLAEGQISSNP